MVLYTIIPMEYIFGEDNDSKEEPPERKDPDEVEIKQGAVSLIGQPLPGGQMKLTRIISTNPQNYLNPEWQPGSILKV
jgi:hypothetical protein